MTADGSKAIAKMQFDLTYILGRFWKMVS